MAVGRSLRASLASILPTWLANVPGLRNLYAMLWTIAALGDCLREIALEGQFAAYPGVGTPDALTLIGQSRGLTQGPNESVAAFATRCIAWLTTWTSAGSSESVVEQIQAYLVGVGNLGSGVYPVVRIVDRAGNAVTANADQSITFSQISWNWDAIGGYVDEMGFNSPATVGGWWSDIWIIIQDPFTHWAGFTDPAWLLAWNSGDQTIDSRCPQAVVDGILTILGAWKGAHSYVRAIVFVPSVASFSPSGYFGNWSFNFSGEQVAARTAAYTYWMPLQGA